MLARAKAADLDSLNLLVEDAGLHGARRSNGFNKKSDCLQDSIYKPESGKDLRVRFS